MMKITQAHKAAAFEWLRYLPERHGEINDRDREQADIALRAWNDAETRAQQAEYLVREIRDRAYDNGDDAPPSWYKRADELFPRNATPPPESEPDNWQAKAASKAMIQPSRHISQQTDDDALTAAYFAGLERGRGGPEQAHGDALAAFERLCNWYSVPGDDDIRDPDAAKSDVEIVRQALTASGVPNESPELIESMQAAFSKAGGFNTPSAMRSVLRAVASAPADGDD